MQYDSLCARRRRLERIGSAQEAAEDAHFERALCLEQVIRANEIVSTGCHGIVVYSRSAAYSRITLH